MSLQYKIVGLFIFVAILPLVIFAGVARQQSLRLADFASDADLVAAAAAAARALEREAEVARATLVGMAALGDGEVGPDLLSRALASGMGPRPDGFQVLEILESDGTLRARAGGVTETTRCRAGRRSTLVRMDVSLGEDQGNLSGLYWAGQDPGMILGGPIWVYDGQGRLLVASSCGNDPGFPSAAAAADSTQGVLHPAGARADGWPGTVAFARVGGPGGWFALSSGTSLIREPVARFFRNYWLFVLSLALTAVLAFAVLLRQVTGSLQDLTRAAERVAEGDLDPWLPTPSSDEIGRLTLAFSDMTDRLRRMVAQVDRSSRLAVLGKLSAFLAHEIRNPLSTVKMNLQRLQRWEGAGEIPPKCGVAIETALKEVDRLSSAVSNILQLSPGKPRANQVTSVHTLVREAVELLGADLHRGGVQVRWELQADSDRVYGQPGQLKGVFINLILNALEAQPEGGELLVSSRLSAGRGDRTGPLLELRFKDQGPGIPASVRRKIFEPFFTTKEMGSGIGLAVASQTIRDHGGELRLEDPRRLGEGAEFVIALPLAPVAPEGDGGELEPQVAPWMEEGQTPGAS